MLAGAGVGVVVFNGVEGACDCADDGDWALALHNSAQHSGGIRTTNLKNRMKGIVFMVGLVCSGKGKCGLRRRRLGAVPLLTQ